MSEKNSSFLGILGELLVVFMLIDKIVDLFYDAKERNKNEK